MQVFAVGDATPKLGEGVGIKMVPFESVISVSYKPPYSGQSVISNRFRRTQQCYRQTDGRTDIQNWYSNSRPDAARYALALVAKMERIAE